MRKRALRRWVVVLAVSALIGGVSVVPAPALTVGALEVDIVVDSTDWSACGVVRDGLTGARYTAVLTATGAQSRGTSQNGVILGQAQHSGNPATPCTPGGFDSYTSGVVYTLEWTSVLGTSGSLTKACVETGLVVAWDPPVVIHQNIVDNDGTTMSLRCTIT